MVSTNKAYLELKSIFESKKLNMMEMFAEDPQRFEKFHRTLDTPTDGQILFDFSKNLIDEDIFQRLINIVNFLNL